jgi:hypothetical protein
VLVLDYSIRDPLVPSISPGFYGWNVRGGSSSMISEPRSWVQFPPATQFSAVHIPPSLTSAEPAGMTASEREQAGGRILDYSIRCSLTPSISPGFYGWTVRGGSSSS